MTSALGTTIATGILDGIGWRLLKLTPLGGGMVYTIAVVDKHVITAWGSLQVAGAKGIGHHNNVEEYASHYEALQVAQELTDVKEKLGYELDIPPQRYTFDPDSIIGWYLAEHLIRYGAPVV